MEYWGGCSVDNDLGDGVGVMIVIFWELLVQWFNICNLFMFDGDCLGVGMVFLFQEFFVREVVWVYVEEVVWLEKLIVLGWWEVFVNFDVLGI